VSVAMVDDCVIEGKVVNFQGYFALCSVNNAA